MVENTRNREGWLRDKLYITHLGTLPHQVVGVSIDLKLSCSMNVPMYHPSISSSPTTTTLTPLPSHKKNVWNICVVMNGLSSW